MASEFPAPDDGPAPDPFEAELVAYLDGELDTAAARNVEARLARDPAARARAAELKKSFDLLDYLPKPDPSPTFTTRTLDKLPTVKPGDSPPPEAREEERPVRRAAVSTSVPVPLEADSAFDSSRSRSRVALAPRGRTPLAWIGGSVAALLACVTIGYGASSLVRSYLGSAPRHESDTGIIPEARVIERLPLYATADDLNYIVELAKPDYFGADPAVSFDPTLKVPPSDVSGKPTAQQFDILAKAFRTLPAARQAEIVRLDQELQAKEPRDRDRLLRVVETYSAWLARLPEADRQSILAAPSAAERLAAVSALRERQWIESLPPPRKAQLGAITDTTKRAELIRHWREDEEAGRDRWAVIRRHAESLAADKAPWPFDTENGRKEVIDFARHIFKTDEQKKCRLTPAELGEYRRTLDAARADHAWAWYGLTVYELTRLHPYLPEPENVKHMYTEPNQLPEPYHTRVNGKKGFGRRLIAVGKWPEYPLEVLRVIPLFGKAGNNAPALGPTRLSEYKRPVREFAERLLLPKLNREEKRELERAEGKWPDHSRLLLQLAHKHNLSVPGVTLPGSPHKWEATYDLRAGRKPSKVK